ncbi:MAG: hypothetical protein RMJ88_07900, partial [Thermogemmata sp.]|nr:hypothetical protein [Thermogemmata sp.]
AGHRFTQTPSPLRGWNIPPLLVHFVHKADAYATGHWANVGSIAQQSGWNLCKSLGRCRRSDTG